MSRIGKKPIKLPDNVTMEEKSGLINVKGPKGELQVKIPEGVAANVEDGKVVVSRSNEEKRIRSFHGLLRSNLANSIHGVSEGFAKSLEIIGTGYKAELAGKDALKLTLGMKPPACSIRRASSK